MKGLLKPTGLQIADNALDITLPRSPVEIEVDHSRGVLYVQVEGVCLLRVCSATFEVKEIR
jgi:hypothetical protein